MSSLKKIVSLCLIIVLIVGAMGSSVLAENFTGLRTEDAEKITITVSTYEIAPGVYLLPWEVPEDRADVDVSRSRGMFPVGPQVEVEVYDVSGGRAVPLLGREQETIIATDGITLFVLRPIVETRVQAPALGRQMEIREATDPRLFHGVIQVAGRATFNGSTITFDTPSVIGYTFVISSAIPDNLRRTSTPTVDNNGRAEATVRAVFSYERFAGGGVSVHASITFDANGRIVSLFPG